MSGLSTMTTARTCSSDNKDSDEGSGEKKTRVPALHVLRFRSNDKVPKNVKIIQPSRWRHWWRSKVKMLKYINSKKEKSAPGQECDVFRRG